MHYEVFLRCLRAQAVAFVLPANPTPIGNRGYYPDQLTLQSKSIRVL